MVVCPSGERVAPRPDCSASAARSGDRTNGRSTGAPVGEAIGVTFQAVQKYEIGVNRLSASRLLLAAKALGRPPSYFFHYVERDVPAQEEPLSRHEVELIRHYRHIDEGTRIALMNLV